eukprot:jgi/Mesvir1/5999/Mv00747-RA.1
MESPDKSNVASFSSHLLDDAARCYDIEREITQLLLRRQAGVPQVLTKKQRGEMDSPEGSAPPPYVAANVYGHSRRCVAPPRSVQDEDVALPSGHARNDVEHASPSACSTVLREDLDESSSSATTSRAAKQLARPVDGSVRHLDKLMSSLQDFKQSTDSRISQLDADFGGIETITDAFLAKVLEQVEQLYSLLSFDVAAGRSSCKHCRGLRAESSCGDYSGGGDNGHLSACDQQGVAEFSATNSPILLPSACPSGQSETGSPYSRFSPDPRPMRHGPHGKNSSNNKQGLLPRGRSKAVAGRSVEDAPAGESSEPQSLAAKNSAEDAAALKERALNAERQLAQAKRAAKLASVNGSKRLVLAEHKIHLLTSQLEEAREAQGALERRAGKAEREAGDARRAVQALTLERKALESQLVEAHAEAEQARSEAEEARCEAWVTRVRATRENAVLRLMRRGEGDAAVDRAVEGSCHIMEGVLRGLVDARRMCGAIEGMLEGLVGEYPETKIGSSKQGGGREVAEAPDTLPTRERAHVVDDDELEESR